MLLYLKKRGGGQTRFLSGKGFTLAEVLITLGIIGIVAAMTLPALIQKYKKHEYSTRLKKFNSTISQAVMMYNAENNTSNSDWVIPKVEGSEGVEIFWNTYYAPYFKNVVKTKKHFSIFYVYFSDGSCLMMWKGGAILDAYFDFNGDKGPNQVGRDRISLLSRGANFSPYWWFEYDTISSTNKNLPEGVTPVTSNLNDRDNVLKLCKYSSVLYCGRLLRLDNWEFKDDYPYKL